jgi:hypothetical protein
MEDEDGQVAGPSTRRYPDRDRRKPAEWYKASFAGSAVTASLKSGDPSTLAEALASPEAAEWLLAMDEEMASLEANGTWSLVPRPSGIKPISAKWVFKTKRTPTGEIERYKALWLHKLARDLQLGIGTIKLYEDNQGAER